jgi:hypothetical protein
MLELTQEVCFFIEQHNCRYMLCWEYEFLDLWRDFEWKMVMRMAVGISKIIGVRSWNIAVITHHQIIEAVVLSDFVATTFMPL